MSDVLKFFIIIVLTVIGALLINFSSEIKPLPVRYICTSIGIIMIHYAGELIYG